MLFFPQILFIYFVYIHFTFIQFVCFSFFKLYLSILYTFILRSFNLYAFLSANCFIAKGQDVFRQTKKQPWLFTPLKKLYASLVTYKGKFTKGIISSFEHYEDYKVCTSLSFHLYLFKSNVCIQIILSNAELHVDSALGCTSVCTSSICNST
jgi:hypothetical protein